MTPRQRMIAAYRGETPDTLPVAPEFWYYIPAKLLGIDMITFEREVPHWEALQRTFRHYGTEGWGCVGGSIPCPDAEWQSRFVDLGDGRYESQATVRTPHGELTSRQRFDRFEPSWVVERPVKDFARDWPAFECASMGLVEQSDWSSAQRAIDAVGEDYLLEVMVAGPLTDYIAGAREGGMAQAIIDFVEHEEHLAGLHERYVDYVRRVAAAALDSTTAESVFVGCAFACLPNISPAMWRRWDRPVIRAVAEEAHARGRLVHIHFHGKCRALLADLADCGADCICPFERPPGGDTADVGEVRRALGGRVTMNGNVHTVETLIRGTPADVRREVEGIVEDWGPDCRRLILGTGDQVGYETPEENIAAMIDAGRQFRLTR